MTLRREERGRGIEEEEEIKGVYINTYLQKDLHAYLVLCMQYHQCGHGDSCLVSYPDYLSVVWECELVMGRGSRTATVPYYVQNEIYFHIASAFDGKKNMFHQFTHHNKTSFSPFPD